MRARLFAIGLLPIGLFVVSCHSDTESKKPAPFPAYPLSLPVLTDEGGQKMTHPSLVVFIGADDPQKDEVVAALDYLRSSSYWSDVTSEYGIGPIANVEIHDPPAPFPAQMTQSDVSDIAATYARTTRFQTSSTTPDNRHADTLYVLVLPATTMVTDLTCTFDGYHDHASATANDIVPFALIRNTCPGQQTQPLSIALVHEIVEAATDPFEDAPAIFVPIDGFEAWDVAESDEVADLCEGTPALFDTNPPMADGEPLTFPSIWSNRLATLGQDPCLPNSTLAPRVFAVATPVVTEKIKIDSTVLTTGVNVAVGQSVTIPLRIATDRPGATVAVLAADLTPFLQSNGETELETSLSSTVANNGDVLSLTITRVHAPSRPGFNSSILEIGATARPGAGFLTYLVVGVPPN